MVSSRVDGGHVTSLVGVFPHSQDVYHMKTICVGAMTDTDIVHFLMKSPSRQRKYFVSVLYNKLGRSPQLPQLDLTLVLVLLGYIGMATCHDIASHDMI